MSGHVYALIFPNGKGYVGQTQRNPLRRFWDHRSAAKNSNRGSRVYRAWRKHGEPTLIILGEFPPSALDAKEAEFIRAFGTLAPCGYNLESGGNEGFAHPETREKISAAGKGRKHSPETLAKMSAAQKIAQSTPERKVALAERNRTVEWTPEMRAKIGAYKKGSTHSPEVRARISATMKQVRQDRFWS